MQASLTWFIHWIDPLWCLKIGFQCARQSYNSWLVFQSKKSIYMVWHFILSVKTRRELKRRLKQSGTHLHCYRPKCWGWQIYLSAWRDRPPWLLHFHWQS